MAKEMKTFEIDVNNITLGMQEDLANAKLPAELIDALVPILGVSREEVRSIPIRELRQIGQTIGDAIKEATEIPNAR